MSLSVGKFWSYVAVVLLCAQCSYSLRAATRSENSLKIRSKYNASQSTKTTPIKTTTIAKKIDSGAARKIRLSERKQRNKKLLVLGEKQALKEATLGTNPALRGKNPTGEGTVPSDYTHDSSGKTPSISMKPRMLSPVNSFKILKNKEFKSPIVTPSRKSMFKYGGIGQLNVKTVKLNPSDLSPGRVPVRIRRPDASRIAASGAQLVADVRPDLYIHKIEYIDDHGHEIPLNTVRKSSAGKWLPFRLSIKNNERTTAYRFDVTVEHIGRDWPTQDTHIVRSANGTNVVVVKVFIPQTATVRAGHKLVFKVDPHKVNPDKNWGNNSRILTFSLSSPIEPDLYFSKFERKQVDSHRDWGAISRGWIEYKYNLEIANRGNAASPSTHVRFKVQKVDNRDNHPSPFLHKDWTYSIPPLNPSNKHALSTGKWKVYVAQQCRVDGVLDEYSRIVELSKGNNHRGSEFSVSVKNPFAGSFLEGLFEAAYDAFLEMGNAIYDGAVWAYNGIKAASQYALAGVICPEMIAWVEASYGIHAPQARSFNTHERNLLLPLYPDSLVNSTKLQLVSSFARPELWGDGNGVTFGEGFSGRSVFVIQRDKLDDSILVHEMVHAYQYKKLGLAGFCWNYIYSWVKAGFSYRGISLEKQAYAYEAYVARGGTDDIETYLGY